LLKKCVLIILTFGLIFGSVAYSQTGSNKPQQEWLIGVSLYGLEYPFPSAMADAVNDSAKKYGWKVDIRDAQADPILQSQQIEEFITKKVDMIVVMAVNVDSAAPACKKAMEAGFPVFALNMRVQKDAVITYVGADDYTGGWLQGEMISEALGGKGNIILLQGMLGGSDQINREQGLKDYLQKNAPDVKLVADYACDWDKGKAITATQNSLTRFPKGELDGIVSQCPDQLMGALDAVKQAGRDELLGKLVGFDYTNYHKDPIRNGELYGTILQDPYFQTMACMDMVWLYLAGYGERVPKPEYHTPLIKVTKANFESLPVEW